MERIENIKRKTMEELEKKNTEGKTEFTIWVELHKMSSIVQETNQKLAEERLSLQKEKDEYLRLKEDLKR